MTYKPEEIWGDDSQNTFEPEKASQPSQPDAEISPPTRPLQRQEKATTLKKKVLVIAFIALCAFGAYQIYRLRSAMQELEAANQAAKESGKETANLINTSTKSEPVEYETIRQKLSDGGGSESAVKANILAIDRKITYEHLKKNSAKYRGQPWAFSGRIHQIYERDGGTQALVSLDGWGSKLVWVEGNFTTDFVEKNQVYVVGYVAGDYSYKSIAGWDITVPLIVARAMLKPREAAKLQTKK